MVVFLENEKFRFEEEVADRPPGLAGSESSSSEDEDSV